MSPALIVVLTLSVAFAAHVVGVVVAWALVHGATRTHHRTDGLKTTSAFGYDYHQASRRQRDALRHAERYGYDVTIPPNSIDGINP